MPPRAVKKTPAGPGSKRGGRGGRGRAQVQPRAHSEVEEQVRVEETPAVEIKDEVLKEKTPPLPALEKEKEKEKDKDKETAPVMVSPKDVTEREPCANSEDKEKGSISVKKDEDVKESVDEYEKGERLDLEDNDPEYEHEEYGAMDYDEKEIEHDVVQEEGDEADDGPEEVEVGEDEDRDMVEGEMDGVHEEIEGDEEDDHDTEEHTELADHSDEVEHHEVVNERRKRKEFEVFVGGLDKDATEEDLKKVFSEVGEVVEVRLMMNPQTKKNKGFAFLRFATVEQAKRACTELKNPVVHGKPCGVTPSQDSDTLFLGNICKTWTKEALREKLKYFGVDNIDDLTLVEDSNNEGMNRGFAFLEFSSRSDAMDAFKRLQKRDVVFGVDRPAKVSFADSFIDPGDEIMAQVKTVFVDGLPASWDENRVREILRNYGEIEKVELARNMPSAKRKDFGFVTFNTHDAAVTCAKSINNEELGEGDSKAKVRARLSRPLQRGRGKHVTRSDYRYGRAPLRSSRGPWSHPIPRSIPLRGARNVPSRVPPVMDRGFKRTVGMRDRRPVMSVPPRARPVAPPPRSYDRRPPVASYPKSSLRREYVRREELPPPRSRAVAEYNSRVPSDRRMPYRDNYTARGSGYPDLPRGPSRAAPRRDYVDDGYGQRYERPPPVYREARGRDYDTLSGSKRSYTALDDVPPRYADAGVRHSRPRLDYELSGSSSQYGDTYSDRLGRSNLSYGGSRSSMSSQDTHGFYNNRQGMNYGGGSYNSSDVGGMYSSSFSGDYVSRNSDVSGSSYSSLYPSRNMGGSSSYMGSGGSGSYY